VSLILPPKNRFKLTSTLLRSSMSIYQFLIAVRQQDGQQLMNDAGETTSHLMGLFYRFVLPFILSVRLSSHGAQQDDPYGRKRPQALLRFRRKASSAQVERRT
jgi:hypothetical protein